MEVCKTLYCTILYCNSVYMFDSISVWFFVDLLIKCNLNITVLYHFEWCNIANTYFRALIITYIYTYTKYYIDLIKIFNICNLFNIDFKITLI